MIDLHFICKQREHWTDLGTNRFETGNWTVARTTAEESIGGRVYLHERQHEAAWHGGTITGWRDAPDASRIILSYTMDGPFREKCGNGWGREKAIVRR